MDKQIQDSRKEKRYGSAAELEAACNSYFSCCDDEGKQYTKPGLILSLDISEKTFQAWLENSGGKSRAAAEALKRAMLRIRDQLERRTDTKATFLLKQACYGGYLDKPAEDGGQELKILVSFGETSGKASEYGK